MQRGRTLRGGPPKEKPGSLGGVLSPLIGMSLVNAEPTAGFLFWGGCYVLSALLFLLIKETGPKVRTIS